MTSLTMHPTYLHIGESLTFPQFFAGAADRLAQMWSSRVTPNNAWLEIRRHAEALRFEEIAAYEDGWDGDGSYAPSQQVIANARSLAQGASMVMPSPDIVANFNGTVTFEWESEAGYATIEVGASKYAVIVDLVNGESAVLNGRFDEFGFAALVEVAERLFPNSTLTASTVRMVSSSHGRV